MPNQHLMVSAAFYFPHKLVGEDLQYKEDTKDKLKRSDPSLNKYMIHKKHSPNETFSFQKIQEATNSNGCVFTILLFGMMMFSDCNVHFPEERRHPGAFSLSQRKQGINDRHPGPGRQASSSHNQSSLVLVSDSLFVKSEVRKHH